MIVLIFFKRKLNPETRRRD